MSRKTSFAKQENDGFGTFFGPAKVVVCRRSNPPLAESEGKAPSGRPKDHKPSSKGVEQKPRPRLPPVLQVDEKKKRLKASRDFSFLDDDQLCPPPPSRPRPQPPVSSSPSVHSEGNQGGGRSAADVHPLKPVLTNGMGSHQKYGLPSGRTALQAVAVRGRTSVSAHLSIDKSKSASHITPVKKNTTPVRQLQEEERRQSRLAPSLQNHTPPIRCPASRETPSNRGRAESYSDDDAPKRRGGLRAAGSPLTSVISLLRRSHPQNHRDEYVSDEDDRGMEADWATIRAEEARSARLGHEEDERERKLEEEREARRLKRLKERSRG